MGPGGAEIEWEEQACRQTNILLTGCKSYIIGKYTAVILRKSAHHQAASPKAPGPEERVPRLGPRPLTAALCGLLDQNTDF